MLPLLRPLQWGDTCFFVSLRRVREREKKALSRVFSWPDIQRYHDAIEKHRHDQDKETGQFVAVFQTQPLLDLDFRIGVIVHIPSLEEKGEWVVFLHVQLAFGTSFALHIHGDPFRVIKFKRRVRGLPRVIQCLSECRKRARVVSTEGFKHFIGHQVMDFLVYQVTTEIAIAELTAVIDHLSMS